ncbi:hypothetical protein ROJ8625_00519 [Roseivivax jejudonensis]|uniref:Lysozyme inhibitor LprI-like N-terminal domain-containing protein n=1 Tax=Roseivivax jejudonensis TaxID=1529041 RepID=A0A1X6YBC7_9RHOB|nr:lysozyme inhibitor LprI family protein [Roseivivax jejudonensis]SLN15842.1 hypothetical protein ROJ8625_00519 [Roseivivax jejudonensis]
MRLVCMFALLAATAPSWAAAQSFPCRSEATQMELTQCAYEDWQAADAELNRAWKIVKPKADRRGQGQGLLQAQRAWLQFRDATCDAERNQYEGGTIAPMIGFACLARVTRTRTQELWQYDY